MKMLKAASALALICAVGAADMNNAHARSNFPDLVPNGRQNSCSTCHVSAGGGGTRNPFGISVKMTNVPPEWSKLFSLDSDGDGYTNGVELGDPDGTWTGGAAGTYASHPGKADSTPCGNAKIDAKVQGSEECDGADFGGKTCADFGGDSGKMPVCTATCTIDSSGCAGAPVDMGMDMSPEDMSNPMVDMDNTPEDMGNNPPADMGNTPGADMGSGQDMGTTTPTTPKKDDDDEGCSSAGMGSPAGTGVMALLGLLGMVGLRRRRR